MEIRMKMSLPGAVSVAVGGLMFVSCFTSEKAGEGGPSPEPHYLHSNGEMVAQHEEREANMSDEKAVDGEQISLNRWLEETYGSTDPSRVLSFEATDLRVPNWRFFFGSLEPAPRATYAVAIHAGRVLEGEGGLVEFFKEKDIYNHPDSLSIHKLAGIATFFLSHYGEGDVMLITDPVEQGKWWDETFRELLHEPRMKAANDGYVLQFWFLQRTLIRVSIRIQKNNEIAYDMNVISELLPPE